MDGIYEPEFVPKPLIPVSDAVGVVVAAGRKVTHIKEGDRVNSHQAPDAMTDEETSTLPVAERL